MIVLNNNICKKCNYSCNTIHFQQNFESWTSGNNNIDKYIQNTQLFAHNTTYEALEWIPYNRFCNIKYIKKVGIFKANWIDGCIDKWDNKDQNWKRFNQNMFVNLKSLNDSKEVTLEFMDEVLQMLFN
jgi:hypothetical protein